jgi:hypothetical protein
LTGPLPELVSPTATPAVTEPVTLPRYDEGEKVATRKAYGDALVALGSQPDVVVLDGEVGNSTHTGEFARAYPDRFFEMFIAEQQMVAAAVGLQVRGCRPFAATFAAFFSRAYDFVRMAGTSRADLALAGSHGEWRSTPTARPGWGWRTWPRCAPSTAARCCTPATRCPATWSTVMRSWFLSLTGLDGSCITVIPLRTLRNASGATRQTPPQTSDPGRLEPPDMSLVRCSGG